MYERAVTTRQKTINETSKKRSISIIDKRKNRKSATINWFGSLVQKPGSVPRTMKCIWEARKNNKIKQGEMKKM